jgi:hypothetical protein
VSIALPALADRRDDIPLLANHFLAELSERYAKETRIFAPEAMVMLVTRRVEGQRPPLAQRRREVRRPLSDTADSRAPSSRARWKGPAKSSLPSTRRERVRARLPRAAGFASPMAT